MRKEKWFVYAMAAGLIFAIFFTLIWTATAAEAMTVWTDHATVKIRPNTPAKPDRTSANLKAAKNEFESFQLIVTASGGALSGVDVVVSDLRNASGNVIPSSSIMIYKAAFINIKTPSTTQGGTGEYPDALIPKKDEYVGEVRNAFPFALAAGRNQPVWIEVYVPPSAAAGVYSGTATVTATGQAPVTVPIQLTVWNFSLPSVSTIKTAYTIDHGLIPAGHGLTNRLPVELSVLYVKANLLHRISDNYLLSPQSLGGTSGGTINWGPFDATFGPFLNGTVQLPGGKLPGNKLTSIQIRDFNNKTNVTFLRNYAEHFKAKGWFDRLFQYTCDEPPHGCSWQDINARAKALHTADPELRSMVTTSVQRATAGVAAQSIDLFTPTIRYMDDKPTRAPGAEPGIVDTASNVGSQRSKYGPEVWWYQACGSHGCGIMGGGPVDPRGYHLDWPTVMIDLPAMFNRVMEWGTFKYDIQGQLYFDTVYAYGKADPWATQYFFGGNGDGTLYYPGKPAKIGGKTHIPIESIRLKMIREGQEDYEYMHLLKTLGEKAFADEQVARVLTNTYTWNREPLNLYDAREKMGDRISSHAPAGTPEPPPCIDPASCSPIPPECPELGSCAAGPDLPTALLKASADTADPLLLHFDGTGSHDNEGAIAAFAWEFGDGESGSGAQVPHRYAGPGTYKVSLTVSDSEGRTQSISSVVSVSGEAGAPVAQWFASEEPGALQLTFDGSASTGGDGSLTHYVWDLGDGTVKTDQVITHQYTQPGSYNVKLTVTNDKNKSATALYALGVGETPGTGDGGGGGCSMVRTGRPTDWKEAVSYLLLFLSPFWSVVLRKFRRLSRAG